MSMDRPDHCPSAVMAAANRGAAAAVVLAILVGCAALQPADTLDAQSAITPLQYSYDAASLFPLRQTNVDARMFRQSRNADGGREATIGLEPCAGAFRDATETDSRQAPRTWCWQMGPMGTTFVHENVDGHLVAVREQSSEDGVEVQYDQPVVFLPAIIAHDTRFEGQTPVRVLDLASGSQRDSGICTYTVEPLGLQRLPIGGQRVEVVVVRERRHLQLKMAESEVVITTGYVRDGGPAIQTVDEATTVMGLIRTTKHRRVERAAPF